jgi:hypothetical protein
MSTYQMIPPRAIQADVLPEVADWYGRICRDVDDIAAKFPDPDLSEAAAAAYIAAIGFDISDEAARSAVERLVADKFRLRRAN